MIKNFLLLFLLISIPKGFSQKDNLYALKKGVTVNYLGNKNKIVEKDKARFYEVIEKQSDSIWVVNKHLADNNLLIKTSFYRDSTKKIQTGKQISYNIEGKEVGVRFFDEGKKIGTSKKWFDDGSISLIGDYENGKQQGSWKFYHTNGKLALEKVFEKGELIEKTFYDDKGNLIPKGTYVNENEKAFFKGGKEGYHKRLQKLKISFANFIKREKIGYGFKGKTVVRYIIGVEGKVTNVYVEEYLPQEIKEFLTDSFKRMRGWRASTHRGRKIPKLMTQKLNLRIKKR